MKTRKYIGKKEYRYLTNLQKTYASIVETTAEFPLVRNTFKGAGYAIGNIISLLDYDLLDYLSLKDIIMQGDLYASNYRHAVTLENRVYWKGSYDEILEIIEKYFDIKLRRDI